MSTASRSRNAGFEANDNLAVDAAEELGGCVAIYGGRSTRGAATGSGGINLIDEKAGGRADDSNCIMGVTAGVCVGEHLHEAEEMWLRVGRNQIAVVSGPGMR